MEGIRDAINYALSNINEDSDATQEMKSIFKDVLAQKVDDKQVADRGGRLTDLIDLIVFG
jgi:hypothetical protein